MNNLLYSENASCFTWAEYPNCEYLAKYRVTMWFDTRFLQTSYHEFRRFAIQSLADSQFTEQN